MLADGSRRCRSARSAYVALTQQFSPTFGVNVSYSHTNGWDRFRGRNINAPSLDGVRPDPALGNVTQVESTARLRVDTINAGSTSTCRTRRTFLFANYAWNRQRNDADGAVQPAGEQLRPRGRMGPRDRRAAPHRQRGAEHQPDEEPPPRGVDRHGANGHALQRHHRAATTTATRCSTIARPASGATAVTTARHVGRRRRASPTRSASASGRRPPAGPAAQMVMIRRAAAARRPARRAGRRRRGEQADPLRAVRRRRRTCSTHVNPIGYSGVMTSPFFSQPTAAHAGAADRHRDADRASDRPGTEVDGGNVR